MTLGNDMLQLILNYDTATGDILTYYERLLIHRAISYKYSTGEEMTLDRALKEKLIQIIKRINTEGYKAY
ncbi:MAG: hypothetical protein H3C36_02380 [Chitinophagaceae bacterium]|nr:hypothetical protein [Chitinophagaceae bacterium]